MSDSARASLLVLVLILIATGFYFSQVRNVSEWGIDSFGTSGPAHGAARELLARLDQGGGRSRRPPSELGEPATIWWIDAVSVCDGTAADETWRARDWIARGGVAVVFLSPRMADCRALGGVSLPELRVPEESPVGIAECGSPLGKLESFGRPYGLDLCNTGVMTFVESASNAPWRVVARLDQAPFVIETDVGSGGLVVVSDASFLTNRWLDVGDGALLVMDLAHTYGAPQIDEYAHGHREGGDPITYLAHSPAWPVFTALAIAGALFVWRGLSIPTRSVPEVDPRVPALEPFVQSLAGVYASTGDAHGILLRYGDVTVERARRAFHLPHGTPRAVIIQRASRSGLGSREIEEKLTSLSEPGPNPARKRIDIENQMKQLDLLLQEMIS